MIEQRPDSPAAASTLPDPAGAAITATTAAAAEPAPFDIPLNTLGLAAPFHWLRLGWLDFRRAPVIGLFYGACFAAMGWMLLLLFRHAPAYTLALSAGFLLMGPFMCLGLYDASRKLERGEQPGLWASLTAWRARTGTMAIFGAVLLVLEMLWGRASLIVFALSFDGMPDFKGSLLALLDPENLPFIVAYVAVGGVFAGLIFAISVIAMPMILDRQTDAITAGLTSLRLCLTQPAVMVLWGALITLGVVLAMAPWFAGLVVAAPVLGHASWHAYRAALAA
ncbi:MAG: DUF2189 domain-containing protein [Rhizobacter sp.]|nr:DUF2189 domain-containing protein [Rhizobacter sp.]